MIFSSQHHGIGRFPRISNKFPIDRPCPQSLHATVKKKNGENETHRRKYIFWFDFDIFVHEKETRHKTRSTVKNVRMLAARRRSSE